MPASFLGKTQDNYSDALSVISQQLTSVEYSVSYPNSAYAQIAKLDPTGKVEWDLMDIPIQPGPGGYQNCKGIRFKSFNPNNPTTVLCTGYFADDPTPTGNIPSTTTFDTSGAVISNIGITGYVKSDGSIIAGSGFTVTKTGTGNYTITFDTALSNTPIILVTIVSPIGAGTPETIRVNILSNTSFHVQLADASFADADGSFTFLATVAT